LESATLSDLSNDVTNNDYLCNSIDCDILCDSFNSEANDESVCASHNIDVSHETQDDATDHLVDALRNIRKDNLGNVIISHVNINSLKHKFDYFHSILSEGILDVLCLTETKLDETYSANLFHCKGFKCHRKDRNARSGGIMVFIRDDIPHTRMQQYEFHEANTHVENMVFEITIKQFKFHLLVVYKNPNVSSEFFTQVVSQTIESLNESWKDSILVGDININMNEENMFEKNVCDVHALYNIVTGSTCFKGVSGTLLDPVVVSNK
jgi:hypothetical protein